MNESLCELCSGSGEVSISKDGTYEGTDYYGCPMCISREAREEESNLKAANIDCMMHFNTVKHERDILLGALTDLLDNMVEPPDRNCSCHISPPCNDCFEWQGLRSAIESANDAIKKAKS